MKEDGAPTLELPLGRDPASLATQLLPAASPVEASASGSAPGSASGSAPASGSSPRPTPDAFAALAAAFAPRFELRERLGRGGMGTVYAATQPGTSRVFALKVLDGGRSANDFARFEREMNLTAQIDHPNVIRVFDFGRLPEGVVYYAMELIRGQSLAELLAATPLLPLARVVRIMLHAARGLAAAHAAGVVHRDIKPENLMVSDTLGWPDFTRILDFGIARTLGHAASRAVTLTSGGIFLGTPRYAAPEVVLSAPPSPSADIYSFGCVLYVMLSGQGPFDAATTPLAMLEAHVRDTPPPVRAAAPRGVPAPLAALVDACLAKEPEARPPSFDAIIPVLSDLLTDLDEEGLGADPSRLARRRTPSLHAALAPPSPGEAVEGPGWPPARPLTPAPMPLIAAPITGPRARPATPGVVGPDGAVVGPDGTRSGGAVVGPDGTRSGGAVASLDGLPEAGRRKPSSRPADAAGDFRAVPQRLMTPIPPRSGARATPSAPAMPAAPSLEGPPTPTPSGLPAAPPRSRERLYLALLVASLVAVAALLAAGCA